MKKTQENRMLGWPLTLIVLTLIFAAFAFGGLTGLVAMIAEGLFYLFLLAFLILFIVQSLRGKPPL